MLVRSAPGNGDVVVRQETREGKVVFVLYSAPGPDQFLLRTREEAVAQALAFATDARARAWFVNGQSDFVLLGEFHVLKRKQNGLPTSVGPAVA